MLARQVLNGAHDAGDAAVPDAQPPRLAALALEVEAQLRPLDIQMPRAQRGEAVTVVIPGIFAVADTDQRLVEKADDGRQHLLPRGAAAAHVRIDALAYAREKLGKVDEALVFVQVAHAPPIIVVAVLLPPPGIPTGGLDVPVRVGADPHLAPGRRHGELAYTGESGLIADQLTGRRPVAEAGAGSFAPDAGLEIRNIGEAGGPGMVLGMACDFGGQWRIPQQKSV